MASAASAPPERANLPRIVAASLIGTTIEWYDNSSDQGYDLRFFRHWPSEVSTKPAPENLVLGVERGGARSGELRTCRQAPQIVTHRSATWALAPTPWRVRTQPSRTRDAFSQAYG
ncbi:hypothetical protein ACFW88_02550 [Streptomyces anandii]|uniref:Uncharacterized protein n=1 Tax=Streptomyces anandii TaxID=285454 RepID=A0ABW6GYJ5_9ACTN